MQFLSAPDLAKGDGITQKWDNWSFVVSANPQRIAQQSSLSELDRDGVSRTLKAL